MPLILYFGVVYRWLFYDQFYWILIDDGSWRLEYYLPGRTRTLSPAEIAEVRAVTGDLWTYRAVRLSILTQDGVEYLSAQVAPADRDYYVDLLNARREVRLETGRSAPAAE